MFYLTASNTSKPAHGVSSAQLVSDILAPVTAENKGIDRVAIQSDSSSLSGTSDDDEFDAPELTPTSTTPRLPTLACKTASGK